LSHGSDFWPDPNWENYLVKENREREEREKEKKKKNPQEIFFFF
jgi:hypothetical protein